MGEEFSRSDADLLHNAEDICDPPQETEDYMEEREELTEERILEMLENRQYKELKEELENNMYPVDLAACHGVPASGQGRGGGDIHIYEQRSEGTSHQCSD